MFEGIEMAKTISLWLSAFQKSASPNLDEAVFKTFKT